MPRLTLALVALVGILAGALGMTFVNRPAPVDPEPQIKAAIAGLPPSLGESDVRTIVSEMLAEQPAQASQEVAALDPETLNPMIESYLMGNLRILQDVSNALEAQVRAEEAETARVAIASMRDEIFNDPDSIIVGNPNGDVTLVEMFDYNCSFCRGALPDLATLIAEDPGLRVVLKEFPILSAESVDAARVAVLVGESDADYWQFHEALFTARGQVDKDVALSAAEGMGLSRVSMEMDMQSDTVAQTIEKSYAIARALNITGTPTYIIGDEVIPGAVGIDELRTRITNMRNCGASVCQEG
jgi:protein-disulfide isomerase